jgi:pilus assembly protein CpaB
MKRARIIVLAIAFLAAAGAAFLAKRFSTPPAPERVEVERDIDSAEVLVAAKEIRLGDAVSAGDLKWQAWPEAGVTPGYVTRNDKPEAMSQLSGSIARAPFLRHSALLPPVRLPHAPDWPGTCD